MHILLGLPPKNNTIVESIIITIAAPWNQCPKNDVFHMLFSPTPPKIHRLNVGTGDVSDSLATLELTLSILKQKHLDRFTLFLSKPNLFQFSHQDFNWSFFC